MAEATFLTRVMIENYRSIAACDVRLGPLTFLVGPNGAGKSNFLDALRLIADALRTSLDHALRDRGGVKEVRRRSAGHPTHLGIGLDLLLPGELIGSYRFRIGALKHGGYEVQTEECKLGTAYYLVKAGKLISSSVVVAPPAAPDRLYLVNAAGLPEFRPVFDALSRMGFYSLNPERMRDLQPPDPGEILARDGSNLASVLDRLAREHGDIKETVVEYLSKVVPGIEGVGAKTIGPKETLEFAQRVEGADKPWKFLAASMSDGTLRALGILVALLQSSERVGVPLVGIEEPEVALHPAAAGILRDCLRDASERTQVVVTSHSPDLLDDRDIEPDSLLAVVAEAGTTKIGPLDQAGRTILRDHLYTAGELLRLNQLLPDPEAIVPQAQLGLFGEEQAS
jgi:predicted ATPase